MNSRQRVTDILNRQIPDCVPMDFGATTTSGIVASTLYKIKKHFGILEKDERIRIIEPYQMLGEIDARTRQLLGIDVVGILPPGNMFGFKNENYKPWTLFDGTPVWVPEKFNTEAAENGNIYMYAGGDRNFPPSAVMPKGGFYFDAIIRQKPIDESKLDAADNCEEFGPLSDEDLRYFREKVEQAYNNTDCATAMTAPGTGFGDIALVPATFLKDPKGIRDVAEWYMSLAARPDYVRKVFEIQCEIAIENLKALYKAVGEKVQIVFMSGTDFGAQTGPIASRRTYRDLFFPFQKKLNDWVHGNTGWKTFIHSCGAVESLIEDFIEAGFDILNPVQISACGMSPEVLKTRYGSRIIFWGGGVDTQKTLPFGTSAEVKSEVARLLQTFKRGGGYVFNAIHNVQAGVPVENFAAMIEAYKETRDY